jgi:hypothetical protein
MWLHRCQRYFPASVAAAACPQDAAGSVPEPSAPQRPQAPEEPGADGDGGRTTGRASGSLRAAARPARSRDTAVPERGMTGDRGCAVTAASPGEAPGRL